jgi:hypothetical protein
MIKQNKLTLKSLQQQLDKIKSNKENKTTSIGIERKSLLFFLSALSWLLLFINKLPIISKIHKLLKIYYGRTTLWMILVYTRKIFIIINAIIGVYAVFSMSGFGYENLLSGFVGMGYNYIEIILNFTKRLFNWFFDLFDYKVVPNLPKNNYKPSWGPLSGPGWYSKPMVDNGIMDVLNFKGYNPSPFQNSNSYFSD